MHPCVGIELYVVTPDPDMFMVRDVRSASRFCPICGGGEFDFQFGRLNRLLHFVSRPSLDRRDN